MRTLSYFLCFFTVLLLTSCEKEEATPVDDLFIKEIIAGNNLSNNTIHILEVRIQKPTPCYNVKKVNKTGSGTTVNYDIIIDSKAEMCATVIAEETVMIDFKPETTGEFTVNFSINGRHLETRKITVVE